jgi:tetratricopeptide (TPR) repeat protein
LRAVHRYRLSRALDRWNRDPAGALRALTREPLETLDTRAAGVLAWVALRHARDEALAERAARHALAHGGDTRFASLALAELLGRRGEHDEAIAVLEAERAKPGASRWLALTLADELVDAGRIPEAERLLEEACNRDGELRRHCTKRLSHLALEAGDRPRARRWFEAHVAEPNYLVYASDYATLAELQLGEGDRDAALATLAAGATIYPRNRALHALRERELGQVEPLAAPRIAPVDEDAAGIRRIPIKTDFITARTGLMPLLDDATRDQREPDDIVVLAESPAASGQGRLIPLELVDETPLAAFLSRFVGAIGPLHSPKGMQGAIMEAGKARVAVAAVAGAAGKLLKRKGWFYKVAGPATAMIDDVAAAMPPNDHHMVFGPLRPDDLATELAGKLGNPVAVVDANHLTGAWVVGASTGVDREWLTDALRDNPAGNEDERTPVVLVRRVAAR